MKDLFLKSTKTLVIMAALFGVITLNSCKDDEEVTPAEEELVEDGFYIQGPSSAYAGYDIKATLSSTRNEVLQEDRATLLDIFVALKTGDGFNIMQVAGAERTSWGPSADFADHVGGTNDEPNVTFQRGGIESTETKFTVPADGLYHVVIDTEVGKAVIVPVEYWGVIGAATPGGWSDDTKLESTGFDMTTMTFTKTEIEMTAADYKFRYSGGWKVELDTILDLGNGEKGIKVNANFGAAVDALVPGGDNINNAESGFYTATMTWTAGSGFVASMVKTGDLPLVDYSAIELGLVGDGLNVGGAAHNWDATILVSTPAKTDDVYTWAYNGVEVNTTGSFKIREGQDWTSSSYGYPQMTMAGDGADDFETNGDGNFVPKVDGGIYDITFSIDAATDTKTFTVTKK
tara:strand:+ start:1576 stop:2784 length:1209 start_codon:yes stop_codon:yes gene_type:complete